MNDGTFRAWKFRDLRCRASHIQAHNLKVGGSNPPLATNLVPLYPKEKARPLVTGFCVERICRGSGTEAGGGTRDRSSYDAPPYVCVSAS